MANAPKPPRKGNAATRRATLQALVGRFVQDADFAAELVAAATSRKDLDKFLFQSGIGDIDAGVKTYLTGGRSLEEIRGDVASHVKNPQPVLKLY